MTYRMVIVNEASCAPDQPCIFAPLKTIHQLHHCLANSDHAEAIWGIEAKVDDMSVS